MWLELNSPAWQFSLVAHGTWQVSVYFWWQSKLLTVYGHIKHWDMIRKVSSDSWQRTHPHKTYQMTTIRTRLNSEWCPALCSLPWWGARCDIYWPFVVRKWPPGVIWQEPTPSTLPWSIDQNMSSRLLAAIKINYSLISLHEVWHGASCRPLPSNIPPQRPVLSLF